MPSCNLKYYGAGPSDLPHGVEARSFHVLLSPEAASSSKRGRFLSESPPSIHPASEAKGE